jgi:hypothetical protein
VIGMPLEYAQARLQARYGARGDEPLWNQIRSARSLPALLETIRASPLRRWAEAIAHDADADDIELAVRAVLRDAIDEVAGWLPEAWQHALRWCGHLVDLPAIERLARGEPPSPWMRRDPVLQAYAEADSDARRAALRAGPLAGIVAAIESAAAEGPAKSAGGLAAVPRRAWHEEWRRRWPRDAEEESAPIEALAAAFERHLAQFAGQPVEDAWSLRHAFEGELRRRFRRQALTPAAAFTYLALVALDLERLRAHLVTRAAFGRVP